MKTLDGYQLYGFFHAGFRRVHAARQHIDRINVFPVPDGDTGTNLSSTLSGALDATVPGSSAATTLAALADAAILSARGNSGVIFAQFISGLSESVINTELRTHELIDGVHNAYLRAKEAVTEPRDGTILSVIETWAISLARQGSENSSIVELIGGTCEDLRRSLAETTDKLAELKAAGVVDAGAAGFVEFVVGGHEFLEKGLETPNDVATEAGAPVAEHSEAAPSKPPVFRYCVEAIVGGESIDTETLRADLAPSGDCLIIAAGKDEPRSRSQRRSRRVCRFSPASAPSWDPRPTTCFSSTGMRTNEKPRQLLSQIRPATSPPNSSNDTAYTSFPSSSSRAGANTWTNSRSIMNASGNFPRAAGFSRARRSRPLRSFPASSRIFRAITTISLQYTSPPRCRGLSPRVARKPIKRGERS